MENDLTNLPLSDTEDDAFQEEAAIIEKDLDLSLIGTCLTESAVHFPSLRNTMADLWHHLGGIAIFDIGEKSYIF